MMNTTIYIFGNLPVFQAALTGLQMIFNPANNTDWAVGSALFGVGPVVAIGLLVSLLHITTKGVWTQKLSLHHVGILLGLYAAMFVPQTNVTVQDIYTGQTVIVDNIPIGVAYPAAIVSQLSYDAATQLGQAFQQATATAPTTDISQGFAEPLQQMLQLRRLYQNYVKTDPALADAEFSFFQQCVYPTYSNDTSLQLAYTQTNDILTTVTHTNYVTASGTNMMVSVLGGAGNPICGSTQGCVMTCNTLASTLQTQYANWINAAGSGSCTAAVALSQAATADTTQPSSSCASAASNLGNVLAQLGTTGSQYIDQMVHACMASAGMSAGGSLFAGTPSKSVLPSYCVIDENSLSQAQVENAGAASMFLKNMLPLMSVLQFLFIAMAPLAAFTMVMAGAQGMGMFVKYIMFGLWTQSWLPVAAMLNAYSQITLAHTLGVIGQAISGVSANITTATASVTLASMPAPPGNGLTLTTIPTVIQSAMQALSNADMLLALTPIITMIVFTGSYMGMATLAQDLGGEDKVTKNAGLETPSVGGIPQTALENVQASGVPGTMDTVNPLGSGISLDAQSTLSQESSAARRREASITNSLNDTIGQTASSTIGLLQSHEAVESAARAAQAVGNTKLAEDLRAVNKSGQSFSAEDVQGLKAAIGGAVGADAGVGIGAKAGAVAGKAGISIAGKASVEGSAQQTAKQAAMHELAEELASRNGSEFVKQLADSHKEDNTSKTAGSIQSNLQKMHQETAALQEAVKNADSIDSLAKRASSFSGSSRINGAAVQEALIANARHEGKGYSGATAYNELRTMALRAGDEYGERFDALANGFIAKGFEPADAASNAILLLGKTNASIGGQLMGLVFGTHGVSNLTAGVNNQFATTQGKIDQTSGTVVIARNALAPDGDAADRAGHIAEIKGEPMARQGVTQYGATPSLGQSPQKLSENGRADLAHKYGSDTAGTQKWVSGKTGDTQGNLLVQGAQGTMNLEKGASDGIHQAVQKVEQNVAQARQEGAAHLAQEKAEADQANAHAAQVNAAIGKAFTWQADSKANSDSWARAPDGTLVPSGEVQPAKSDGTDPHNPS